MDDFLAAVDTVMRRDAGGRGLSSALPGNPVTALWEELPLIRSALLMTGFPVRLSDGSYVCETDGPSGIIDLAAAFSKLGILWRIAADEEAERIIRAGLKARGLPDEVRTVPETDPEGWFRDLLDRFAPSHVITLELPGKAADGHYYNMRGIPIDGMIADTAAVFPPAKARGIRVISVGDGGNEAGMGTYRELIEGNVPHGELICAADSADIALVSGVSNWWGIGLCALLSKRFDKDLLPTEVEYRTTLEALIAAGSADGVTKEHALSVDRLPLEEHLALLRTVRRITGFSAEQDVRY